MTVARRAIFSLISPKPACCINSHPCLAPCLLHLSRNFIPDTLWETHHLMLPQRAQCLCTTTTPPHVELLLTCELDCKDLAHCFPKLYLWPLMWSFFTPTSPDGIEHQSTSTASLWRTSLSWPDLVLNKEHLDLSWLTLLAEPWHRHGYIFICLAFLRVLIFAVFADQGEIAKFYTSKIFI